MRKILQKVFTLLSFCIILFCPQIINGCSLNDLHAKSSMTSGINPDVEIYTSSISKNLIIDFKVNTNSNKKIKLEIYNIVGSCVMTRTFSGESFIEIPILTLQKGIFFVIVSKGENTYRKKILIQ